MGSPCELLAETTSETAASELAELATTEVWRIEKKFSRYLDSNVIDNINTAQGEAVHVDEETARLLDFANTLYELSEGLFDITSGILRRVWTFDGTDRLPTQEGISKLLPNIGWQKVLWQSPRLTLPVGMEIDLGGIGKEYAVDRAVMILRQRSSTPCLVNLGGDLAVTGAPERAGDWTIGIDAGKASPLDTILKFRHGAIATSGDGRRYQIRNGIRYSHILNPTTGWSVGNAASSITVASTNCVHAGMLSTLAMLRGAGAEAFLDGQPERSWIRR